MAMKPLFWQRIQMPAKMSTEEEDEQEEKNCLWERLNEKVDWISDDFLDSFSRHVPTTKNNRKSTGKSSGKDDNTKSSSSTSEPKEKKKKVEAVQLLEQKRAHNVGILITSLRLDISVIESAILNFDVSVIGTEKLQQIHEVAGTQEEISLIDRHLKQFPDAQLSKAERFLYDLSRIPQFHERVNCIMHEIKFAELLVSIENTLSTFKLTCSSLTSKSSIQEIFAIILTLGKLECVWCVLCLTFLSLLGNYMNGGNRDRGQADGFGLEILNKLKDVKGKDNGSNLLEYVVKIYIKQFYPNVSSMENVAFPLVEPADIEKCSIVVFSDIENELNELNKILRQTSNLVKSVLSKGEKDENDEYVEHIKIFNSKMETFLEQSTKQTTEQEDNLKDCKKK